MFSIRYSPVALVGEETLVTSSHELATHPHAALGAIVMLCWVGRLFLYQSHEINLDASMAENSRQTMSPGIYYIHVSCGVYIENYL